MDITFDNVKQVIVDTEIAGELDALQPDTTFESVGVDSLDNFNLLLGVEEAFGVKIPEENVEDLNTISKLVDFLKSAK